MSLIQDFVDMVLRGKAPRTVIDEALELGESYHSQAMGDKWGHIITGDNIRYRWDGGGYNEDLLYLEELPGKPIKKKVRRLRVTTSAFSRNYQPWGSPLLIENIMHAAGLHATMTYDAAKAALTKAVEKAVKEAQDKGMPPDMFQKWGGIQAFVSEDQVSYLEVEPHDYQPISAKGKDFTITSKWTDFSAYSPSSDFSQADPFYQYYGPTSAQGARMLFQALKADATILRNVSWMKFSDWCRESGIGCTTHSSVWH